MVKPIELDELLLRVRALLRRANIEYEQLISNILLDIFIHCQNAVVIQLFLSKMQLNYIYSYEKCKLYYNMDGNTHVYSIPLTCLFRLKDYIEYEIGESYEG